MREGLLDLLGARRGHFVFESGHHGELWLDLDALFTRPARLAPFLDDLAVLLGHHGVDLVCGPLSGGGFVAYEVAARLDAEFCYAERTTAPVPGVLHSAGYEVRSGVDVGGRTVAVVDDVVNAGSATGATIASLREAGAVPVAVGALLVLGTRADALADAHHLALETTARLDNTLWDPDACPLCAEGIPVRPGP